MQAKALQDETETTIAGRACLPAEWRDDEPSDEKARKLLKFFKTEFFRWVNQPSCEGCSKNDKMKCIGMRGSVTSEERIGMASTVERYVCEHCGGRETPFPRMNNPRTLMQWRKGRCGEWANCFCALAVSAGFATRFVIDLTDHVWGEIYSPDQKRWIHCDPCENAFDAPLMYESGWNKSLSWVFAFESGGFCKDVTRRYSRKWDPPMLERRIRYASMQLTQILTARAPRFFIVQSEVDEFQACVEQTLPETKKKKEAEAEEAKLKPEEARGRISGSEEWRKARGEFGDEKKEFRVRYQKLLDCGKSPNEAAVIALREMSSERGKEQAKKS